MIFAHILTGPGNIQTIIQILGVTHDDLITFSTENSLLWVKLHVVESTKENFEMTVSHF